MKKKKSTGACCEAYSPEKWEIEEDLRCLTRAKAVEADPERMKKVKALAKEKLAEYQRRKDEAQEAINLAAQ
jgi:hypothetical protein